VHLATLVHDDSVDHSVLRRGMPTINSLFSHQVSVIMGDYLFSRAMIELVRIGDMHPLRVMSRVTNDMTVGEMRQLLAHDYLKFTEEDYDLLIKAKTASLIAGACEVGAYHAEPRLRDALGRFGEALGMAFQIVDDLLDYTEDTSVTGKPSGLDLREHKMTLAPDRGPARDERGGAAGGDPAHADPRAQRGPDRRGGGIGDPYRGPRVCTGPRAAAHGAGGTGARGAARYAGARGASGVDQLRRRAAALMPSGPRRTGFYLGVLAAGFIAGGFLNAFLTKWMPESAAKAFFTSTWTPTLGPVSADLLVLDFTLGPVGLHVSLLSLLGVVLAYLIARSLF
jgi:hypothetical protein